MILVDRGLMAKNQKDTFIVAGSPVYIRAVKG